jgi:hypothetical protein
MAAYARRTASLIKVESGAVTAALDESAGINYGKSSGDIHLDRTTETMHFASYGKALNVLARKADV